MRQVHSVGRMCTGNHNTEAVHTRQPGGTVCMPQEEVTDYIIHLTHGEFMGVNGEALQLHAVYKELYFLL